MNNQALSHAAIKTPDPLRFEGKASDWFWGTLWKFRGYYVESMVATVVANILTLASVFFTMNVYDRVVPSLAFVSLWTLAIGTATAIVLEFLMRWIKARLVDLGGKKADLAINATLLREIMAIKLEHRPQSIGVFASSMRDFDALRDFFSSASLVLVADFPFVLLFVALIGVIAGPLIWIPVLAIPLLATIGLIAQRPLMRSMREGMKQAGDRQSVLVESVLNLELLKAHNAEDYLQRRWETANLAAADSYKKTRAITNFMLGLTASTQQLVTVVMVVFGVYLIADNALTLGGLIASVILAGRAIAPLSNIMSLASRYQQARSALETLDGLMQRPSDHDVTRQYVKHEEFTGKLVAQDVEFAYPGEHRIPVVRGVSMTIAQGERIGLLGKVGSGKSTLLRLFSGLYTPTSGTLTVDDVDLRQIDPCTLRKHIGYVGQDPQLFRGTLRENLRLSDTSISDRSIIETLKRLDLHTIVESHPLGLNMQLTEAGGGLSGGQRQLVAIARMMLRNPIYVFMDEPTANMDQVTEARVIDVMNDWLKGRTLLLATHRLQLLFWVQRVAVIEKGICLADGPRDEVMREIARGAQVAKSLSDLGNNPGVAG
ncbi:MAG: type I secretion system permease/ATPase [Burkholderiaceae bacterium]|nr:type I secretion system permease/ATPase [Burkholderiaceae bacterium]